MFLYYFHWISCFTLILTKIGRSYYSHPFNLVEQRYENSMRTSTIVLLSPLLSQWKYFCFFPMLFVFVFLSKRYYLFLGLKSDIYRWLETALLCHSNVNGIIILFYFFHWCHLFLLIFRTQWEWNEHCSQKIF